MKKTKEEIKADELIEMFKVWDDNYSTNILAIICVDEIIKSSPSLPILSDKGTYGDDIIENRVFWQSVKQILIDKQK